MIIRINMHVDRNELEVRPRDVDSQRWLIAHSHEWSVAFDAFSERNRGKPIRIGNDDDVKRLRCDMMHELRLAFPEVRFELSASTVETVTTQRVRKVCP